MKAKIVHVVGARPNFVKAAPVIRSIKELMPDAEQILIHTGQHYDKSLSGVFFSALEMPKPDINLKIGSSKMQGQQVADVVVGIEKYLSTKNINLLIVYGDVNSTLGATLAAVKMGIKVAHVESGLRSFDRKMPEEINRMIVDRVSDFHFVTEHSGIQNLVEEGHDPHNMTLVGNTMIDSLYRVLDSIPEAKYDYEYVLVTLHRPSNVDTEEGLKKVIDICDSIDTKIVFPMHPRTRNSLSRLGLLEEVLSNPNMEVVDPVGYFEFVSLMKNSLVVLTDSGGIQEETTALGIPCLTLRKNTERPATIHEGTNKLVDTKEDIVKSIKAIKKSKNKTHKKPTLWDGKSGPRIANVVKRLIKHGEV